VRFTRARGGAERRRRGESWPSKLRHLGSREGPHGLHALLWWLLCLAIFFRGAGRSVCWRSSLCRRAPRARDTLDILKTLPAASEGTMGQNFREAVRQFDENFAPRLM